MYFTEVSGMSDLEPGTEVALEALSQLLVILQHAQENSNPESNDH